MSNQHLDIHNSFYGIRRNREDWFNGNGGNPAPELFIGRDVHVDRVDPNSREPLGSYAIKNSNREVIENDKDFDLYTIQHHDYNEDVDRNVPIWNSETSRFDTSYQMPRMSKNSNTSKRTSRNFNNNFQAPEDENKSSHLNVGLPRRISNGFVDPNRNHLIRAGIEYLNDLPNKADIYSDKQRINNSGIQNAENNLPESYHQRHILSGQKEFQESSRSIQEDSQHGRQSRSLHKQAKETYENLPETIIKGLNDMYGANFRDDDQYTRRHGNNSIMDADKDGFASNLASKALLPKIYSDDIDLMNPKPMTGSDQFRPDRHYDTLPLVAKKSTRPSVQDMENSMTFGRFDPKAVGDSDAMYNTNGDAYERQANKSARRRRNVRRDENDTGAFGEMSKELVKDQTGKVATKVINGAGDSAWNKIYERPNQLSLSSNNQDLFKERPKREGKDRTARNRTWSTSSSDSYCSIESSTRKWNRTSTPDSTSSSPIIWNFSHFYMERKVPNVS
ncbi:hypothetical protein M8J76_010570 [Diaphorina citri]|nr:hypothetical protein M8J75_000802 [Diaphorina citri]KAI5730150.1 hypothetical protein M8J76_010570 [Diaphorina citri]KAI5734419.1 hypothetical protein M8J77_006375 [Diaphorina citri]